MRCQFRQILSNDLCWKYDMSWCKTWLDISFPPWKLDFLQKHCHQDHPKAEKSHFHDRFFGFAYIFAGSASSFACNRGSRMKGRMGRQQAKYYARSHRKNLRVSLDTNKKSSFALMLHIFFEKNHENNEGRTRFVIIFDRVVYFISWGPGVFGSKSRWL